MKIEDYKPCEQLRPFVKAYKIIECAHHEMHSGTHGQQGITNRVVPNTSAAIAFRLKGQISYISNKDKIALPSVTISGLRKTVRLIHYEQNSAALIVQFKEQGISAFFCQPLHELFEQSVSLDHFIRPAEVSLIEGRLAEIKDNSSRIARIEQFLISKLNYLHPSALVTEAIAKIYSVNGNIRIKQLSSHLHISQDAFEKRFRKMTGTTPKQFSYIIKMNAIVRQTRIVPSFLDVAFENGYYDQPHFNKDFKMFTGQTPSDFLKSASFW